MKKLVLIAIIAAFGWKGYAKYQVTQADAEPLEIQEANAPLSSTRRSLDEPRETGPRPSTPLAKTENTASTAYRCDGRTHCSQMTSCTEATYFLKNCPGAKMDGNHDGIPCEMQWCK